MQGSDSSGDNLVARLLSSPINDEMIVYVTSSAASVIKCTPSYNSSIRQRPSSTTASVSTSMSLSSSSSHSDQNNRIPTLELFVMKLAARSKVHTHTFLCTLVYLARLRKKLPEVARGTDCTRHRIFLATLIIASKYLNDASPKNLYWARYTSMFSLAEVNLMERQLLELLDYDLRITNEELYQQLEGLCMESSYSSRGGLSRSHGFAIQPSNPTQNEAISELRQHSDQHHVQSSRKRPLKTYVEAALKRYRTTTNIKTLVSKANLISLPSIEHLYTRSFTHI